MMQKKRLDVRIWRGTETGAYRHYSVQIHPSQTVLDLLTYIQRNLDSSLAYRFACRVGMCGSCAMMVNGKPRWTCRTRIEKLACKRSLQLAPLRNLPIIRDLVTDMTPFFDKWRRAQGYFQPSKPELPDFPRILPSPSRHRTTAVGDECINCGICYAACDVVRWNPDYLGPAALNRAWTLVNDKRDRAHSERLRAVAGDAGCHACHSEQACLLHCPIGLNPAASIAALKRTTALAALRGKL